MLSSKWLWLNIYVYSYSKPLYFSPVLLLNDINALSFLKWNLTFCCFEYAFLLLLVAEISLLQLICCTLMLAFELWTKYHAVFVHPLKKWWSYLKLLLLTVGIVIAALTSLPFEKKKKIISIKIHFFNNYMISS